MDLWYQILSKFVHSEQNCFVWTGRQIGMPKIIVAMSFFCECI